MVIYKADPSLTLYNSKTLNISFDIKIFNKIYLPIHFYLMKNNISWF